MLLAQTEAVGVRMQMFNQINARKIKDEYNPFSGLRGGAAFVYILLIEVILQVTSILFFRNSCWDMMTLSMCLV